MHSFKSIVIFFVFSILCIACKQDPTDKLDQTNVSKEANPGVGESSNSLIKSKEEQQVPVSKVYTPSQVDEMPIYSNECKQDQNPSACSQLKVREYITANLVVPASVKSQNLKGREVITFIVNPDGSVSDNPTSISKKEVCSGCRDAAIKVIDDMPNWSPGMKDGQPVAVKMAFAVPFK